jgi:hypothetical protein
MTTINKEKIIKWTSFSNLHSWFQYNLKCKNPMHKKDSDYLFDLNANFTIKIDGSNLSIHIKKIDDEWIINSINGRNLQIWNNKDNKPINKIGKYGNVGNIENLPLEMFKISILFAEKIKTKDIIIYGEVFRAKYSNLVSKYVSWHPFGYCIPIGSEIEELILIESNFFSDICPIPYEIIDYTTFLDYLVKSNKHCIFPPSCLFSGKIGDGIIKFKEMMSNNELGFEGFFIVIDSNNGYKWKTSICEEQKYILSNNQCRFINEKSKEIYKILEDIFNQKKKIKENFTNPQIELHVLKDEITNAFNKEYSKILDFSEIPKKDRLPIVDKLIDPVVKEVISHYIDSDIPIPWSDEEIKKTTNTLVKILVMKI